MNFRLVLGIFFCLWPFFSSYAEVDAGQYPNLDLESLKVRHIFIKVNEIFDDSELNAVYRFANQVKASTKKEVVKRELLLKEGDAFDQFLLEESERNLRALSFLRKVKILPVAANGFVDLHVSVQDTWTFFPEISLSLGDGEDKKSISLTERNAFGYGKRYEIGYQEEEGRDRIRGIWEDPRVAGSNKKLLLAHFEQSDGYRNVTSFGRPFRSLVEPYSWEFDSDFFDLVNSLYESGDERFIYRQRSRNLGGRYTKSYGDPEKRIRRYSYGYHYSKDIFREADDEDFRDVDVDPDSVSRDPALLASNRTFSGPTFGFQQIEADYLSTAYIDRFDRVEDFNLGNEFSATLNYAAESLSSDHDTFLFTLSQTKGWKFGKEEFLRAEISSAGRIDNSGFDNYIFHSELRYYNILGEKYHNNFFLGHHTVAFSASFDLGEDLDLDKEFLLGADTGLRGYESKSFSGDHRFILNLEDRVHIVEDVWDLFSLGGAFFIDAGGVSRKSPGNIFSRNFYADFGFGLRIGIPRSSSGTVVRLDVAFPLRDSDDGSNVLEPRILLTTGQAFSNRLKSESRGPNHSNLSQSFLR